MSWTSPHYIPGPNKSRACCTSAAPWFFKPQAVSSLGTYQDGGLQHNNPASIAQWESRFLWPHKDNPDFALSLGTGFATEPASLGLVIPRFYTRLFKSFMRNLNGEDAWIRFHNSLDPKTRPRYHRLNVKFTGPEPSLDDAKQIPSLKAAVIRQLEEDKATLTPVVDSMLASMFYFELDALPIPDGMVIFAWDTSIVVSISQSEVSDIYMIGYSRPRHGFLSKVVLFSASSSYREDLHPSKDE